MASVFKRAFTFANVVAVLALTISLSGGVYAAAKINGKDIKKQSIAGKKLKKDTLTGKQVKESSLQGFATLTDLKGLASAANTQRIRFEETVTSSAGRPVLALGTLRMDFDCVGGDFGIGHLKASTTAASAAYDMNFISDRATTTPTADVTGGLLTSNPTDLLYFDVGSGSFYRAVATFVYNSNSANETITVHIAAYWAKNGSSNYCNVAGTAVRTPA